MADTVASILGVSIPPEQPLMEAGLDSLGAVDLRNALGAQFSLDLPATFTFDYPTVAAMAAHISGRIAPILAAVDASTGPHWRDNALVQRDFGDATSVATQVVGMSCIYPGVPSLEKRGYCSFACFQELCKYTTKSTFNTEAGSLNFLMHPDNCCLSVFCTDVLLIA